MNCITSYWASTKYADQRFCGPQVGHAVGLDHAHAVAVHYGHAVAVDDGHAVAVDDGHAVALDRDLLGAVHDVCLTGRHSTTLYDAETDFKTGKSNWGHSGRNSETKRSLKRDLVKGYITDIVSLQSEEQPNQTEVDVDVGDDDSDLEDITFQRDSSSNWQVHTGGKQRGGVFNKRQAKRHMDPVLVKHLHRQYEIDMAVKGTSEHHVAKLTMFQDTWNKVLKDMIVYIRKNKGASGICIRLLLRSFLVLKLCCFPR
jgi:hypothetical protein